MIGELAPLGEVRRRTGAAPAPPPHAVPRAAWASRWASKVLPSAPDRSRRRSRPRAPAPSAARDRRAPVRASCRTCAATCSSRDVARRAGAPRSSSNERCTTRDLRRRARTTQSASRAGPARARTTDRRSPTTRRSACTGHPRGGRRGGTSSASRVEGGPAEPDGRVTVTVRAHSELMVARQLAGFADALEVRSPAGCAPAPGRHRPRAGAREPLDAVTRSQPDATASSTTPPPPTAAPRWPPARSAGCWPAAARRRHRERQRRDPGQVHREGAARDQEVVAVLEVRREDAQRGRHQNVDLAEAPARASPSRRAGPARRRRDGRPRRRTRPAPAGTARRR